MIYIYQNKNVELSQLQNEIQSSAIVTALDSLIIEDSELKIVFKASLSTNDETLLGTIVTNHTPLPITETAQAVKIEETPPFAKPDYRIKRDGSPTWTDISESDTANSDYQLTEERYVSGGECIVIGAKKGDWISAEVVDANAAIPEQHRAILCENWPVVAEYVVRANLVPSENAKEYILNTYPLNGKITPGLVLRIVYHSSAEVGVRSFCSNYYLTKKL